MKQMATFVCLLVLSVGIWLVSARVPLVVRRAAPESALTKEFARASAARQKGEYSKALELFRAGYRQAQINGEPELEARFLWGIGNCHFAQHYYQEALREYLAARDRFEELLDRSSVSALNGNLASLYQRLGEFDAAIAAARLALSQDTGTDSKGRRARLLILAGGLLAEDGKMVEARRSFEAGIVEASRFDDPELISNAWDRLGSELLLHRNLAEAEQALLEGYRIRKLHHLTSVAGSYGNLGLLRFEQGDLRSALALIDASLAASKMPGGRIAVWCSYYVRGRLRLSEGKIEQARADFTTRSNSSGTIA